MKTIQTLYFLALLGLFLPVQSAGMLPASGPTAPALSQELRAALRSGIAEKKATFKKLRKKLFDRGQGTEGEKPSKLAWWALGTFAAYFFFSILLSLSVATIFSFLAGVAFLASLILAIVILATEDNRKSKLIAKIILFTYGILLILGLFLILLILAAWGW